MAQARNPSSGKFAATSPAGAAVSTSPSMPTPGPTAANMATPLPLLPFTASSSPCQSSADLSALSQAPAMAGPVATNPTTPMQDLGQVMGQTATHVGGGHDAASS